VLLIVVAPGIGVAASGAGAEAAPTRVIQGDHVVGGLRMARGTATQAVARFGTPTSKRAQGQSCLIAWGSLGLAINFLSFEGQPCTKGVAVVATVTNRAHWRTALGLRKGDTIARLKTLFPHAVRQTGEPPGLNGFWLVPRRACEEVGGQPFPGLLARIINGRVSALVVRTGVCE
jgi:hypothetical protein